MAETVIHMNPDDGLGESYEAVKATDQIVSIQKNAGKFLRYPTELQIRVTHSGRRKEIQDKWDEALKATSGKIVYAEQVSIVLQSVGGFDAIHCEVIRKNIAKKKDDKVSAYKELFNAKLRSGFQDDEIDEKWWQITNACQYVFNRSHHLAYHCQNKCRPNCPICEYEKDVPTNRSGISKSG